MQEQEQRFAIGRTLAQAILDYLYARPYGEVHRMVAELERVEPLERPAAQEAEGQ